MESDLKGLWILDFAQCTNGKPLEVNHPLFSQYMEYTFDNGNIKINGQTFKATFDAEVITLGFRRINYRIEGQYLIINDQGDNKEFHLLTKADFLAKYPEFLPRATGYHNETVYEDNPVVKPDFNHSSGLDDYLQDRIPSYGKASVANNFFKAQFVVTASNEIKDISIINGISEAFDRQFIKALKTAQKHFVNDYGKNLLVTHRFNFFKMGASLNSMEEKTMYQHIQNGDKFYENGDFENAISAYQEAFENEITPLSKERWGYLIDDAYINLGVSLLAIGDRDTACQIFSRVGDRTNFKARNFLINYCE